MGLLHLVWRRSSDFRAIFIRAPAVLEAGPGVEALAHYKLTAEEREKHVRQGCGWQRSHQGMCTAHCAASLTGSPAPCWHCHVQGCESVIVAVKSGVLLATAFHPELTTDTRWWVVLWPSLACVVHSSNMCEMQGVRHRQFAPVLYSSCHRHQLFVEMVRKHAAAQPDKQPPSLYANLGRQPNRPLDLPIYAQDFMKVEVLPVTSK